MPLWSVDRKLVPGTDGSSSARFGSVNEEGEGRLDCFRMCAAKRRAGAGAVLIFF